MDFLALSAELSAKVVPPLLRVLTMPSQSYFLFEIQTATMTETAVPAVEMSGA